MTSQSPRKASFATDADELRNLAAEQEFAFADIAPDGRIRSLNPFARLCWGWSDGASVPEDVRFVLDGLEPDASEVLPLKKGDLFMHGIRRSAGEGWMIVGYERRDEPETYDEPGGFDTLIRNMPVGVFRMRTDGTVEFANPEAQRMTGYPMDEIVGNRFWTRVVVPEHTATFETALRSVARKRSQRLRFSYRAADGLIRQSEIHLFFSEAYSIEAVLLEARSADAPGSWTGEAVYDAVDQGPEGFLFIDDSGTIRFANHRVRELIGIVTVDAWMNRLVEEAPGFTREAAERIRLCVRKGDAFRQLAVSFETMSGTLVQTVLSGSPVHRDGQRAGCAMQMRMTEQSERTLDARTRYQDAVDRLREVATTSPDEILFLDSVCRTLGEATLADRVRVVFAGLGPRPTTVTRWMRPNAPVPTSAEEDQEIVIVMAASDTFYVGPESTRACDALADALSIDEAYWIRVRVGMADAYVAIERFPLKVESRSPWSTLDQNHMARLGQAVESYWSWIEQGSLFKQFSGVLDDVQFAFVITDEGSRRFRYMTDHIEDLTGRPGKDWTAVGADAPDWVEGIVHPEDRPSVRAHDRVLEQGVESRSTYRILHRDGSIRWVTEHAVPMAMVGGAQIISGILSDITERKAAEEVLVQSKREAESANRQKTAFIATLSHEIRTPVGAIQGYVELLGRELSELAEQDVPIPENLREFVTAIDDRSRRLVSLVQDLFDLSTIETGQITVQRVPVAVHSIVRQSASRLAERLRAKGIRMKLQLDSRDPKVLGDARRIEQVIDGLLSNAVKFTDQGSITLTTKSAKRDVVIEVVDTGVGIATDYLEKLFTPFTQEEEYLNRRFDGTGLGLSLVKRLLDMMGGRIEVESEKERGSTFRVFLPAVRGTVARGVPIPPRAPRS